MRIGKQDYSCFTDVVFGAPNEPDSIYGEAYGLDGKIVFEVVFFADFTKTIKIFDSEAINIEEWNKMSSYVIAELEDWDKKLRKPLATWDPRLLADPLLNYDDLVSLDRAE